MEAGLGDEEKPSLYGSLPMQYRQSKHFRAHSSPNCIAGSLKILSRQTNFFLIYTSCIVLPLHNWKKERKRRREEKREGDTQRLKGEGRGVEEREGEGRGEGGEECWEHTNNSILASSRASVWYSQRRHILSTMLLKTSGCSFSYSFSFQQSSLRLCLLLWKILKIRNH